MTRMKNELIDTGHSSHSAYSWLFPCFRHVYPCYRCYPWFVTFLCPFVEKHHLVKELHFGADGILRAARKFELFVLRIRTSVRKIRVKSVFHPWLLETFQHVRHSLTCGVFPMRYKFQQAEVQRCHPTRPTTRRPRSRASSRSTSSAATLSWACCWSTFSAVFRPGPQVFMTIPATLNLTAPSMRQC